MTQSLKIGIVGPESTGKSVLGKALAAHYQGTYVPEYARTYVEALGRDYTYEDVCRIAERDRLDILRGYPTPLVFFDAGIIVEAIWLDVCYGQRPAWLTTPLPGELQMDVYLLTAPDIAWVADPTRENGDDAMRQELFLAYQREVEATGQPYAIVSGQGDARTNCAILLIDSILRNAVQ